MPTLKKTEDFKKDEVTQTTGKGWAAVAGKKNENEANRENGSDIFDFYLKDGESARIQILEEEPYCFDAHSVKTRNGKYTTEPCQLETQKHCVLCDSGFKPTWRGCLKVLDFRGTWEKGSKPGTGKFKHDKPIEKRWLFSNTLATQLKAQQDKRGNLTKFVFEITRSGSTAQDTTYNIEIALDDDDVKIKPVQWDEKYPPSEELCHPSSDVKLEAKRYLAPNDK